MAAIDRPLDAIGLDWLDGSDWIVTGATGAIVLVLAIVVHATVFALIAAAVRRSSGSADDAFLKALRRPTRWLLSAAALAAAIPSLPLEGEPLQALRQLAGLAIPALVGWVAIAALNGFRVVVDQSADISVADNLRARQRRTRVAILHRIAVVAVVLIALCLMLMSIPSVRAVGVTLAASAGLAALAVGAAAQPALKTLIGGVQMALTEPIRLDDVVIVEGEWGRIEEIRLTYVVVRIWDDRRLVVPVTRFLEASFENWTRQTSALMGAVTWHLDPAADIARLRARLEEIVRADPLWDGRFFNLQVTGTGAESIEVRALVTARDAGTAFDLRCNVREAMLAYIAAEMPEATARRRGEIRLEPAAPVPG